MRMHNITQNNGKSFVLLFSFLSIGIVCIACPSHVRTLPHHHHRHRICIRLANMFLLNRTYSGIRMTIIVAPDKKFRFIVSLVANSKYYVIYFGIIWFGGYLRLATLKWLWMAVVRTFRPFLCKIGQLFQMNCYWIVWNYNNRYVWAAN